MLAFIILVVSISVIFSYSSANTSNMNVYQVNQQVLNSFTKAKINDLNDEEIRDLFKAGLIKNIENTIAQQVSEFHYMGNHSLATNLTRIFIKDFITKQMNANITLYDNGTGFVVPYELYSIMNRQSVPIEKATITSVTRRVVLGFINETDFYGPYEIKIEIWQ